MNTQFTRCIYRAADLQLLNTPRINAVFLKRSVPRRLTDFLTEALANEPDSAFAVKLDSRDTDLATALTAAAREADIAMLSTLDTPGHRLLLQSLARLVRTFRRYSGREKVSLELHVNRHNLPRFHVDWYPHIMTRTFIGQGTLWVPREYVDEATREDYFYPQVDLRLARQVPTGWLVFERGGPGGFIHSSPQENISGPRFFAACVDRSDTSLPSRRGVYLV